MKEFNSKSLKKEYISFFESKGHKKIESASLFPENDSSVLFTTAGMQPLVPYLLGESHPEGKRIVDSQKCLRTNDILDIGDNSHLTFFEMLGNWSLGDYFKHESIAYSYEFLTEHLMIPVDKLAVTVFEGDKDAPKDVESAKRWEELGIKKENIYYLPKEHNWWWAGDKGPCGPDTEIFYIFDKPKCGPDCSPACDCGRYMEIWNNVFMEYNKTEDGLVPLKQKNVDTGMGLERVITVSQNKNSVYETDIFYNTMKTLNELTTSDNIVSKRIVADHLRASLMIINDGGIPSNVDQGYVLRRLIRRSARHMRILNIGFDKIDIIIEAILLDLKKQMGDLNVEKILKVIDEEVFKFEKTLSKGLKKLKEFLDRDHKILDKSIVFKMYDTFGFPPELTKEIAKEHGLDIDFEGFKKLFKEHQEKSRKGAVGKFKGGLGGNSEKQTKYHTATHLLNAALKEVVSSDIHQRGSNITDERLRFDFNCDHKLTDEEKKSVEDLVNKWISEDIPVTRKEMSKEEAISSGAECMFIEKYPDIVTVYSIGDISSELCGGPHVSSTGILGHFKIKKEESSSSGVRRIKAILED